MRCFPEVLSEDLFSLKTGQERCALSFGAVLDSNGQIVHYEVTNSTIVPTDAIAYPDIAKAVEGGDQDLKILLEISKKR